MPLQMRFNSLARSARSGFLPPSCSGNPCTTSSGQVKRLRNRKLTSRRPIPLCYALPLACSSLLACCLRAPMRSRSARFVAALRSRSVLICSVAPLRLVGVALSAGAPAPLTALQASPALLRARAPAGCRPLPSLRSGESRPSAVLRLSFGQPTASLRPRGLRYAPPVGMHCARGGLPILSACRGAVALTADSLGNLPPRSIVLGAGSALADHVRFAHQLNMQKKC